MRKSNFNKVAKLEFSHKFPAENLFCRQGLIEAETDNGIPCFGASNLSAQTK